MAKISPVSIKYMIHAKFEAEGSLEKPDVIGALFGQTEGLLGSDLEMRDLQKEGKIGRIEVELESGNGKTYGKVLIPSALDKTETTLIAAAIETIERIGPSNAKIEIEKLEDVRENKRQFILERAKKLLENIEEKSPKTREFTESVKVESRMGKLKEYGEEKLPSGNLEGNEIIVVEGRADVLNLLRNNMDNVIGMDGTKLPKTIKELSYNKEITLFLDGDRGGKLIAKNVIDNARIDFVAFAPDGKEVEELSGKEIWTGLRKKIPVQEFLRFAGRIGKEDRATETPEERIEEIGEEKEISEEDKEKLSSLLKEVENTRSVLILDNKLEIIGKTPVRNIFSFLSRVRRKPFCIIVDTAISSVIKAAEEAGIKNVAARNFVASSDKINLISL